MFYEAVSEIIWIGRFVGRQHECTSGAVGQCQGRRRQGLDGTKENASKVADDGEEAYDEGKDTSLKEIKEEIKEQGAMPVKPKEDEAGIPVD